METFKFPSASSRRVVLVCTGCGCRFERRPDHSMSAKHYQGQYCPSCYITVRKRILLDGRHKLQNKLMIRNRHNRLKFLAVITKAREGGMTTVSQAYLIGQLLKGGMRRRRALAMLWEEAAALGLKPIGMPGSPRMYRIEPMVLDNEGAGVLHGVGTKEEKKDADFLDAKTSQ